MISQQSAFHSPITSQTLLPTIIHQLTPIHIGLIRNPHQNILHTVHKVDILGETCLFETQSFVSRKYQKLGRVYVAFDPSKMVSGNSHTMCLAVVALSFTIQSLIGPMTAFTINNSLRARTFHERLAMDGTKTSFSTALSAGGFGKAPTSKKKKNAKPMKEESPASPAVLSYDKDEQKTTMALTEWLDEEEVEGLEGVEIGISKPEGEAPGLRGVFATRDFLPGEYIMAVPYVSTLLVDEDFDATRDPGEVCLRADEPEAGFRFWDNFFCHEENQNKYKAFLDCLPGTPEDPNFDGTPDFWSEDDIRKLEIPGVVDKMLARKEAVAKLVDRLPKDQEDSTSALTAIQQCCWLVQSRAFTTYKKAINLDGAEGLLSRVVLIPFIDMINHASRKFANAEMQVVETKEYDESFYALVSTKPIQKGTEIQICYGTGEETSLELFSKYGFWPQVEDPQKEKATLQQLLENVEWSTTLEEDEAILTTDEGMQEPLRTILSIRIYAKKLQA